MEKAMEFSIWDMAIIAAWIVVWFAALGALLRVIGAIIKKRRQRTVMLSAAAMLLSDKLKESTYSQEQFDEIIRKVIEKDGK